MGLFGKKKPTYISEGRGYEITPTGAQMRAALLEGEPSRIVQLVPECAAQVDPQDALALHLNDVLDAFSLTKAGELDLFVQRTTEPPAFPRPANELGEPEQYTDFACEKLFEAALLMIVLRNEKFVESPEYGAMLDKFVETYKWTKLNFLNPQLDGDIDVAVGIGKHFQTFDGVVGGLISDHNIRGAAARLGDQLN